MSPAGKSSPNRIMAGVTHDGSNDRGSEEDYVIGAAV